MIYDYNLTKFGETLKDGTHVKLIWDVIRDGAWHNAVDIIYVCKPNTVNWALRSRVADIKSKLISYKYTIESEIDNNGCAKYRIAKIEQLNLFQGAI